MEMATREMKHYNDLMEKLKGLLPSLTSEELHVFESMTNAFLDNHSAELRFEPLTEAQITEKIDTALKQISEGQYQDSEEMEAELLSEFGL